MQGRVRDTGPMFKGILVILLSLVVTSCGTTEGVAPEESASPIATDSTSDKPEFSITAFSICYPIKIMTGLEMTLTKVDEGLLSKQDLEDELLSLSSASEFSTMSLDDPGYYEEHPELEQILPVADLSEFTKRTKSEGIWYARARVKLIDNKVIDIQELKNRLFDYRKFLNKYCADYKN